MSTKVFIFGTKIGSFRVENSSACTFSRSMIERYVYNQNVRVYWMKMDITQLLDNISTKLSKDLTYYAYFREPHRRESIQRIPSFSELLINYLYGRFLSKRKKKI